MPRKSVPRVVGPLLRDLRTARRLSQEALASRAGLHRTYIGLLERSLRDPTAGVLSALLDALGVSWGEFGAQLDERRREASPLPREGAQAVKRV
ncbi:MAG TPA: helix-turn-helix transcriptional regulator [Longimicrobiaceae bacterium]|nr:helix-turn-helix transcriptional regulator [Longimicrobiaceae bacterium]